jgi:hypothetical protein
MGTGAVPIGLAVKWSVLKTTRGVGTPQLWIDSIKLVALMTRDAPVLGAVRGRVMTSSFEKRGESQPTPGIGSLTEKWYALLTR